MTKEQAKKIYKMLNIKEPTEEQKKAWEETRKKIFGEIGKGDNENYQK